MTDLRKMFLMSPDLFNRLHGKKELGENELADKMKHLLKKKKSKKRNYSTLAAFRHYQLPYLKTLEKKREPVVIPYLEPKQSQPAGRPRFKTRRRTRRKTFPTNEEPTQNEIDQFTADQFGDVAGSFLSPYFNRRHTLDTVFGMRRDEDGTFRIGNSPVTINDDYITIGSTDYPSTPGLWELLTKKHVDASKYDQDDLSNYRKILVHSKAHVDKYGKIKSSKNIKYKTIVSRLFPARRKLMSPWTNAD